MQEKLRLSLYDDPSQAMLLLVEHPRTITLGRGEKGQNLLADVGWLKNAGFDIVETNRGGKITYHGPGQLVAYPVVDLRSLKMGIKDFVHALEQTMIQMLLVHGIQARNKEGWIGTWVDDRKIGSIGIHVRKHVSIHGLALNVCTDLSDFAYITPCGIQDVRMTSLVDLGITITFDGAIPSFVSVFSKVFGCTMELA